MVVTAFLNTPERRLSWASVIPDDAAIRFATSIRFCGLCLGSLDAFAYS